MPTFSHTVTAEEAGRTVKSLALKALRLSRGMFSSLKFRGGILVDGAPARADVKLRPGQVLSAHWEDEAAPSPAPAPDAGLSIAYVDDQYWIVEKPAPLPTLGSPRQSGPTVESALYSLLGCPAGYVFRPVNRLDKGTSGLLCVARNAHAQQRLQRLLHTEDFVREYLAVCEGAPPAASGVIDLPIGHMEEGGVRRTVRPDGLRAVTHYQVEAAANGRTLLRLRLETGRTHQIRVHLSAVGCPIAGDYLYGAPCATLSGRFALHACLVRFTHPFTGEIIQAESPLPPELASLLRPGTDE